MQMPCQMKINVRYIQHFLQMMIGLMKDIQMMIGVHHQLLALYLDILRVASLGSCWVMSHVYHAGSVRPLEPAVCCQRSRLPGPDDRGHSVAKAIARLAGRLVRAPDHAGARAGINADESRGQ